MSSFAPVARELARRGVRYVLIGVTGANMHAHFAGAVFSTQDRDLFLPPEPENLLAAWQACAASGLELWSHDEPLGEPTDLVLARGVVASRALTRATDGGDLHIDLTLTMKGFDFDEVWPERVLFSLRGVEVPVARLLHIVRSKAAAGRDKDRLFLATHADSLAQLLPPEERPPKA